MFKPKKQIWRDNTEPPKNYIWERLNESGSYIGTYEYNGSRWVKIKEVESGSGSDNPSGGTCSCGDKFVVINVNPNVVYANDNKGKQTVLPYSESGGKNSVVIRTDDGRIKSADAKDVNDVVTLKDLMWNE